MAANDIRVSMTPPHPGAFVRAEIIEPLGLSVTKAAEALGVRRATLSDVLNGKASVSPEMALRLESAFDVRMDLLLKMQVWHDTVRMRARADTIQVGRYAPTVPTAVHAHEEPPEYTAGKAAE